MPPQAALQALRQYRSIGLESEVSSASPVRLVQMLMEGALTRLAGARVAMERGQIGVKGEQIGKAIDIVEGLRLSLDHEQGGELAANLEGLYDYMVRRLVEANLRNDPAILDEIARLLGEIKRGWDALASSPSPAASSGGGGAP